jgi:serine/threonine protein kinase
VAKIVDFGTSRKLLTNATKLTITGTEDYMAPEMKDGKKYNKSCDVYSFGKTFREMFNCRQPITDNIPPEIDSLFNMYVVSRAR